MNNVELVKQGYQYFAEGNVEAVLALFHPEMEWNECKGFPHIAGDGLFIGPDAIVQATSISRSFSEPEIKSLWLDITRAFGKQPVRNSMRMQPMCGQ
jgi:hypothetical protein